jgi:hypothetical protein
MFAIIDLMSIKSSAKFTSGISRMRTSVAKIGRVRTVVNLVSTLFR